MKNKRDYYDILGVRRDVGERELKSAYRKLGKQYHPDANPDNADAETKMKEINEAYAVLSDSQKRAEYDQHGHSTGERGGTKKDGAPFTGGFDDNSDINFDDIFRGAFGDFYHAGEKKGEKKSEPTRGRDVSISIHIEFDEAISGAKKEVSFNFSETCESCNGTGVMSGTAAADICQRCNGSGQERVTTKSAFGKMTQVRECSVCHGKGKPITEPCSNCYGKGYAERNKKILVKIPKGIKNGQTISISGMGEPGKTGGSRGNLLIKVHV